MQNDVTASLWVDVEPMKTQFYTTHDFYFSFKIPLESEDSNDWRGRTIPHLLFGNFFFFAKHFFLLIFLDKKYSLAVFSCFCEKNYYLSKLFCLTPYGLLSAVSQDSFYTKTSVFQPFRSPGASSNTTKVILLRIKTPLQHHNIYCCKYNNTYILKLHIAFNTNTLPNLIFGGGTRQTLGEYVWLGPTDLHS